MTTTEYFYFVVPFGDVASISRTGLEEGLNAAAKQGLRLVETVNCHGQVFSIFERARDVE